MMSYTMARRVKPQDFNIRAMCELTRELGLDGVDFVTTYGRPPAEIRRMTDDFGLKIICHTFLAQLNFPDTKARQAGLDTVKQGIEAAVILGTDRVMLPTPGKPEFSREESRRNFIAGLQESAAFARQMGVTLTVENFPGAKSPFVISSDVLEAVREVPGLQLTFDNGNVLTGAEDPAESFRKCAKHIIHAHFKDWTIREDGRIAGLDGRQYRSALIGEGIVDHRSCLAAMRAAGYTGFINIEYEGDDYPADDAVRKATCYLRECLAEIG